MYKRTALIQAKSLKVPGIKSIKKIPGTKIQKHKHKSTDKSGYLVSITKPTFNTERKFIERIKEQDGFYFIAWESD